MTLNDQGLAKIIKDKTPITISRRQFIVESSPVGTCDGCYFLDKNCPAKAVNICCSNGGNILKIIEQTAK